MHNIIIKKYLGDNTNYYKQTVALLNQTKKTLSIDHYLLLKKILVVGAIVDYLQRTTHLGSWIKYQTLLERNLKLIQQKATIDTLKICNGLTLTQPKFFVVNTRKFINTKFIRDVEIITLDAWKIHYN